MFRFAQHDRSTCEMNCNSVNQWLGKLANKFGFSSRTCFAPPGSVTRVHLRRWSVRNLRNTDQPPERIQARSGRLFRRLLLRVRGKCLADRPAPLRQSLRYPAVAALSPLRAWLRRWPIRRPPESQSGLAARVGDVLPDKFVRAVPVRLSLSRSQLQSPRAHTVWSA